MPVHPVVGSVLVVCTGNICRSPAAELVLRNALAGAPGVRVGSAGLQARAGEPIDPPMRALLASRGLPVDRFTARQLTPELLGSADLVLTMTAAQRSAVVDLAPAAVRRTFLLREFAGLAGLAELSGGQGAAAGLAALVGAAPRLRALRPAAERDDIADPFGRGADAHVRALAAIDDAIGSVLAALRPRAGAA